MKVTYKQIEKAFQNTFQFGEDGSRDVYDAIRAAEGMAYLQVNLKKTSEYLTAADRKKIAREIKKIISYVYVVVSDDRQGAVNKVTIEVPAGRTIEDAEMFWEERLKAEGIENIDYAVSPRGQVADNTFILGWNEQ